MVSRRANRHIGIANPAPYGLVLRGPLAEVLLIPPPITGPEDLKKGGIELARLMVDTGASKTCVDQRICDAMALRPIRFSPVVGVSGKSESRPVYRIGIGLRISESPGHPKDSSGGTLVFRADVYGVAAIADTECRGLLGRDFLMGLRLIYDGPSSRFELVDRRGALETAKQSLTPGKAKAADSNRRKRERRAQHR